jgi:branched-chain amino acid transport system substrate-binding protein
MGGRAAALISTAALLLSACSSGDEAGGGDEGGTVRIGAIMSLSGPLAESGKEMQQGFDLAVERVNADGGVPGGQLEVVYEDDKSNPEQAVVSLRSLTDQGVQVVSGTLVSPAAVALANFVRPDPGLLYVISSAATPVPLQDQEYGNIFGLSMTNAMFGKTYHAYIADSLHPATVAVVAATGEYGDNEIAALKDDWGSGGPEIVGIERFELGSTDFSSTIATLRSLHADAVYFAAGGTAPHIPFFRQAAEQGLGGLKLMNPLSMSPQMLAETGKALEGVYGADLYNAQLDNPENTSFVEAYQAEYGKAPNSVALLGYESVWLVAQGMISGDSSTDVAKISAALKAKPWNTPRGEVRFDETGRAVSDVLVVRSESGEIAVIE